MSVRRDVGLAALLAIAAIAIRLPYLNWGLPELEEEALPLKKAFEMWGWDAGRLQLDPGTAGWPSLSFYIHLLLQQLMYLGGRLGGAFANRYDFWLLRNDLTPLVLAARGLGVLAAGGTVYVATRLGARLAGAAGGLLVGALLAVSPLLVRQSRLITPDILLTFCAVMAVARLFDVRERGAMRDHVWAGIWIGLGISIKYSPILLAPALVVVHLLRRRHEAGVAAPSGRRPRLGDRRLLAAAGACALTFVLTSPFVLFNLDTLRADFTYQLTHLSQGHFGQEGRGSGALFYLRDVLVPAFGLPGFVLAVAGLGWAAGRRRGLWLVPAVCCLCLYLGLGLLRTRFDRYMLPLLPPLALGLAAVPEWLRGRLRATAGRTALLVALALVVLIPPARAGVELLRRQSGPSTLQQARQYLTQLPGADRLIYALEAYTPALPVDQRAQLAGQPILARLSPAQRARLATGPTFRVINIPMYMSVTELSDFYYDLRHYLPVDVIVTSGTVRDRYERDPARYPRQVAFYRDLDRYARLERAFTPGATTDGPELRIYRFADAGRQRLVQERGLGLDFTGKMKAPHLRVFLERVAAAAAGRGMDAVAELYIDALRETAPAPADRPGLAR
ncbi:MAG: ArnT family glycosyltransferase [Candidatus Krumholzibacteriia bacterium]